MAGTVSWISIAPVKGMRIQSLEKVELNSLGVPGDRAFFLADESGAMVNGKRLGSLMQVDPEHDPVAGTLTLRFPDGSRVSGTVEAGQPEPVTFFGNEEMAQPITGEFSAAISAHVGQELRLMKSPEERGGVDRGKWGGVTLLGASSLEELREAGRDFNCEEDSGVGDPDPGPIDQRRFRMTFGLEETVPFEEDRWIGSEVRVGDALVKVAAHVGRCAVTTRDPMSGETDLKTLHFLKHSRDEVDSFEPLPFGVYGEVIEPGMVRLGDPVLPSADRLDRGSGRG